MACAVALAAIPLARGGDELRVIGARVAIVALLALLAALVLEWPLLVPAALVLLGGLYAAELRVDHAALDGYAAVVAAGLVVTAELAYWSLEERERFETERGETVRRLAAVALLGVASALVAETLLALAAAVRANGLPIDLVGAGAAAAVLLAVVVLARRRGPAG